VWLSVKVKGGERGPSSFAGDGEFLVLCPDIEKVSEQLNPQHLNSVSLAIEEQSTDLRKHGRQTFEERTRV
jgi:hypothetical protein